MNRRHFFSVTVGALAASVVATKAPRKPEPPRVWFTPQPITWKGIPIIFNRDCPSNAVYFLSPDGPYRLGDGAVLKMSGTRES